MRRCHITGIDSTFSGLAIERLERDIVRSLERLEWCGPMSAMLVAELFGI